MKVKKNGFLQTKQVILFGQAKFLLVAPTLEVTEFYKQLLIYTYISLIFYIHQNF